MATIRQRVERLAKKQNPGRQVWTTFRPNDAKAPEQAEARQELKALEPTTTRLVKLCSLHVLKGVADSLGKAARFVLDVDADPTSLAALEKAATEYEAFVECRDALAEARELEKALKRKSYGRRCSVSVEHLGGFCSLELASGDTWTEVLNTLKSGK